MAMLEVNNVTKSFGGLTAVNKVTFSLESGELVGLIGPNGAGKSTLFNVISGFYKPNSGSIKFEGEKIAGLAPHQICKRGIARTFQLAKPFADLSVKENAMVAAFCRVSKTTKAEEEACKALEQVGLTSMKDNLARNLSVPNLRRLELARALVTQPRLLLLDEVAAGLSPEEVQGVMNLLGQIVKETRVTLMIVEHVLRVPMGLCQRIIVLDEGSKIADSTPVQIASDPKVIKAYLGEEYSFAQSKEN